MQRGVCRGAVCTCLDRLFSLPSTLHPRLLIPATKSTGLYRRSTMSTCEQSARKGSASERRRNTFRSQEILPESNGQNLALAVLYVPCSRDSEPTFSLKHGQVFTIAFVASESTVQGGACRGAACTCLERQLSWPRANSPHAALHSAPRSPPALPRVLVECARCEYVQGSGFRVQGQGSGYRVQGAGCRV